MKAPRWVVFWIVISMIIVMWDALFMLNRPRSLHPDGDLAWLFPGYDIYTNIDRVYGEVDNAFGLAQSIMNLVEVAIGTYAVILVARQHPAAVFMLFVSILLTFAKTLLYFLHEASSGFENVKHNEPKDLLLFYILPNGLWVIVPGMATFVLGSMLIDAITEHHRLKHLKQS